MTVEKEPDAVEDVKELAPILEKPRAKSIVKKRPSSLLEDYVDSKHIIVKKAPFVTSKAVPIKLLHENQTFVTSLVEGSRECKRSLRKLPLDTVISFRKTKFNAT